MAKKTYILTSGNVSDDMINAQQEEVLDEMFGTYTFIVSEKGGAFIVDETESMALIQEFK